MFSLRSLRRAACVTGLGAALVLVAQAQAQPAAPALTEPARTLQASDAASPVPALPYRSVFADLPRGVEEGSGDWKAANKAVSQFPRGHIDLLQWEKARAAKPKEQP
ncbi:MAG: hypothetical protein U5L73_02150 [Rhodoferax sp.]|uniref:hypothetical protein n=1 Tax=Rhodoferax sp. TaxID=50421 RepID=UPI002ACF0942|nr:hypothetical protein [Rhodoferax sp.]MDZ7890543.1 hypothetical protein [Rhodoferax sp.]